MSKKRLFIGIIFVIVVLIETMIIMAYYPVGDAPERRATRTPTIFYFAVNTSTNDDIVSPLPYPLPDTPEPYIPPEPVPTIIQIITPPWLIIPTNAPTEE